MLVQAVLSKGRAKKRGLTPRSSGAPSAGHQARAALWFILHRAGLASCRCRPLTSTWLVTNLSRPRGWLTWWDC